KFGQADLAGSVSEWNLDVYADPYINPCNNCANLKNAAAPVVRGGNAFSSMIFLSSFSRATFSRTDHHYPIAARCARNLEVAHTRSPARRHEPKIPGYRWSA